MAAVLQLIQPKVYTNPSVEHPRPFKTYYYGAKARLSEWSAIGHAGSPRGAALAALRRIIDKRCVRADIYGEDGVCLGHVERRGSRIIIVGV